jgi:hypothetical protein
MDMRICMGNFIIMLWVYGYPYVSGGGGNVRVLFLLFTIRNIF